MFDSLSGWGLRIHLISPTSDLWGCQELGEFEDFNDSSSSILSTKANEIYSTTLFKPLHAFKGPEHLFLDSNHLTTWHRFKRIPQAYRTQTSNQGRNLRLSLPLALLRWWKSPTPQATTRLLQQHYGEPPQPQGPNFCRCGGFHLEQWQVADHIGQRGAVKRLRLISPTVNAKTCSGFLLHEEA